MAVNLEERVDRLETIFGQFVAQTGAALLRMERDTEALKREMQEFKREMSAFKVEMLSFKDEMLSFKDEMRSFKDEMRAENRQMNRKWGELANKMGTMVEDLVQPSLKRIIAEMFNLKVEQQMIHVQRRLPDEREKEYDAIALAGEYLFLNSTKTTLRNQYVDDFIEEIRQFREFFPEYGERKIIGMLAALNIQDTQLKFAEKKGLIVLGVGDQIMEVKNSKGFKPRIW